MRAAMLGGTLLVAPWLGAVAGPIVTKLSYRQTASPTTDEKD